MGGQAHRARLADDIRRQGGQAYSLTAEADTNGGRHGRESIPRATRPETIRGARGGARGGGRGVGRGAGRGAGRGGGPRYNHTLPDFLQTLMFVASSTWLHRIDLLIPLLTLNASIISPERRRDLPARMHEWLLVEEVTKTQVELQ